MSTAIQICPHWIRPDLGLRSGIASAVPAVCPWCEAEQLRGNLSLAEEGLANYQQENEQLREDNSALRSALRRLATDARATADALAPLPQDGKQV